MSSLTEVYSNYIFEEFTIPNILVFVDFREVPVFMKLLDTLKCEKPEYYPDLIMVDGNSILHNGHIVSSR